MVDKDTVKLLSDLSLTMFSKTFWYLSWCHLNKIRPI